MGCDIHVSIERKKPDHVCTDYLEQTQLFCRQYQLWGEYFGVRTRARGVYEGRDTPNLYEAFQYPAEDLHHETVITRQEASDLAEFSSDWAELVQIFDAVDGAIRFVVAFDN